MNCAKDDGLEEDDDRDWRLVPEDVLLVGLFQSCQAGFRASSDELDQAVVDNTDLTLQQRF